MIIEITQSQFYKWLNEGDSYQKWSIETIDILWDYYTELEIDCGEQMKFDFVAIRSEWHEYYTLKELREDYDRQAINDVREVKLTKKEFLDWLEDETIFFKLKNGGYLVKTDF
jgi:hypothetical protein